MSTDAKPSNVRELYVQAVRIEDGPARQAFLDEACGSEIELRQRVEGLLAARAAEGDNLLQRATSDSMSGSGSFSWDGAELGETIDSHPEAMGDDQTRHEASRGQIDVSTHPMIGNYRLLEELGHGGMGTVYMAQQSKPVKRQVALKVIKPGMDSGEVIARFEAERQALAMMDHPNIARVLDGGTTDEGRPYFVMELVRGVPITEFCKRKSLPLRERLELFVDVCHAVQHAHQKGIIHRDLKPSNIMVTLHDGKPVVKVIDFGVAKALHQELTERTLFTQFSQMLGTPLYMAPEQAEMSGLGVDTRSDIYSLGVVLYELLTGTTPFDRDTLSKLGIDGIRKLIQEQEPPRPSARISTLKAANRSTIEDQREIDVASFAHELHRELDWIVLKALEKDRERRYESANALAADVQRYLDGEVVEACPPSLLYRSQKYAKQHRRVLATAACVLLTALVGSLVSLRYARNANRSAKDASRAQTEAELLADDYKDLLGVSQKNEEAARAASQDAKIAADEANQARKIAEAQTLLTQRLRYQSDVRLAAAQIDQGLHADALTTLVQHAPELAGEDLRDWEWYELLDGANRSSLAWQGSYAEVMGIDWSPNGREIATVDHEGACKLWDAATGELIRRWDLGHTIGKSIAWSPDGQYLAWGTAADESVARVWDREADQVVEVRAGEGSILAFAFDQDSRRLLISAGYNYDREEQGVSLHQLVNDQWQRNREVFLPKPGSFLAWDRDGDSFYGTAKDGTFARFTATTGEPSELSIPDRVEGGTQSEMAYSSQGGLLAVGYSNGWCAVCDAESGQEVSRFRVHLSEYRLTWSHDGTRLATAGADGFTKVWNATDGELIHTFSGHRGEVHRVTWNPDDSEIACCGADGSVFVWKLEDQNNRDVFALSDLSGWRSMPPSVVWVGNDQVRFIRKNSDLVQLNFRHGTEQVVRQLDPSKGQWKLFSSDDIVCVDSGSRIVQCSDARLDQMLTGKAAARLAINRARDITRLALVSPLYRSSPEIFDESNNRWITAGTDKWISCLRLRWSPDGSQLAIAGRGLNTDGGLRQHCGWVNVIDGQSGRILHRDQIGDARTSGLAVAWSPDGKWLASSSYDGTCEVHHVSDFHQQFARILHRGTVGELAWHPDGGRVASAGYDQKVNIWDAKTGEVLRSFELPDAARFISWSPNGERLIAATARKQLYVWTSRRGKEFEDSSFYTSVISRELISRVDGICELGQWTQAEGIFYKLSEIFDQPEQSSRYLYLAALCALAEDRAESYQEYCHKDLQQAADVGAEDYWTTWMHVLSPRSTDDWQAVVEIASKLSSLGLSESIANCTHGAALFRAGQHQAAREMLVDLVDGWSEEQSSKAYVLWFLAMNEAAAGDVDSAESWLVRAQRETELEIDTASWNRRLTLRLLSSEAKKRITP